MILRQILLRVITASITLIVVSILIFAAVELLPGESAARVLGRYASEEAKQAFRRNMQLDDPPVVGLLPLDFGCAKGGLWDFPGKSN